MKAMPEDLHEREWGKMTEVLEWLKADGYPLSRKNLYKHYGPKSARPVKRKDRGKDKGMWFYPELLERVRLNRDGALPPDYDTVNALSAARMRAEVRIKEAEARTRELSLAKMEGKMVDVEELELSLNLAAQAMESRRKSLCSSLPAMLAGLGVREMHKVLDGKTAEWMAGMVALFEEASHGS